MDRYIPCEFNFIKIASKTQYYYPVLLSFVTLHFNKVKNGLFCNKYRLITVKLIANIKVKKKKETKFSKERDKTSPIKKGLTLKFNIFA